MAALRVFSVLFALAAAVCLGFAIAGMVRGEENPARGYGLRVGALGCFAIAVLLNVIRH